MQAVNTALDVKLKLVVPGNVTPIAKRIPANKDFATLMAKAKALAGKHGMLDDKEPIITYKDEGEWANLEVEDDDDLELALAKAYSNDSKSITFFIKTSKSVAQVESKVDEDEEMKQDGDKDAPVKGKKNKEKNGKMPRKALKNLINQEFEKQSREIFQKLLKSKDLMGLEQEQEKTADEAAQDLVEHTGVECDGCGVAPIKGIRYKCSVRKDYDLCQMCEERLNHPHALLKIKEPNGAPDFLLTILDGEEEEKGNGNEFENLVQQFASNFRGGFGGRGGRGGCKGGRFNMKKLVSQFAEKMGNCNNEEFQKTFNKHFGPCGTPVWKQKRAVVVKKPEDVIEATPGQCVITEIEILNDTNWPWKPGCKITLDDLQSEEVLPIEVFSIPVEKDVKGKQQEKFEIGLTVLDHMVASEKVYEIMLTFRGPRGNPFGEKIPLKIRIGLPKASYTEADVYKLAIKFHENGLGSIEQCASVVKQHNCDEAASLKALTQTSGDSEMKE